MSAIAALMEQAIVHNMRGFLDETAIAAARETMGIDHSLIDDGTYFLVETMQSSKTILVGCGGWGKRKTLYGGDHTTGRDDTLSNPATDPARIRAMYTHPDWVRCGVGTYLLTIGEAAARAAGFQRIELGSTVPGEPLYRARGYQEVSRSTRRAANGSENTIIKMGKAL